MGEWARRLGVGLAVSLLVAAAAAAAEPAQSAPPGTAVALSQQPIADNPAWTSYVETPTSSVVRPVAVVAVSGKVANPQALAHPASGQTTTLTYQLLGKKPSLILDYGQEVGGFPTLNISAGAATVRLDYSETLANMGNDDATSVALFQSGQVSRSTTFSARRGAYTSTSLQGGERYERLTLTSPGTLTLSSAGIVFTPPRTPLAGHFLSSDDQLNKIWYAGAYTLDLNQLTPGTPVAEGETNQQHLILDGAKRDRAVWSGDHMISDLTDYYVSDPVYARDSLSLFLNHPASTANFLIPTAGVMALPGPLPGACTPNPLAGHLCVTWSASYSLAVLPALANYYLYTGDLGFVRANWPAVVRQMAWDADQVDKAGLFAVKSSNGDDWNTETTSGELTFVNALYVAALRSAASLAAALGLPVPAATWGAAAAKISAAVNAKLWNPTVGDYDASTTSRGTVVQDGNVTAILAGITSPAKTNSIIHVLGTALATPYGPATVSNPGPKGYKRVVSPYMGGFQVLAELGAGDEADALALIRQEWGFMITQDPGGVEWERIQLNGIPAGGLLADSTAHAWSTGPTPALSQSLVGVTPASAGFATWSVAPQPSTVAWAQGSVPTPHGAIDARWLQGSVQPGVGQSFVVTVSAPAGTSGTVTVPLNSDGIVARDGQVIWSAGHAAAGVSATQVGNSIVVAQGPGTATYAST